MYDDGRECIVVIGLTFNAGVLRWLVYVSKSGVTSSQMAMFARRFVTSLIAEQYCGYFADITELNICFFLNSKTKIA